MKRKILTKQDCIKYIIASAIGTPAVLTALLTIPSFFSGTGEPDTLEQTAANMAAVIFGVMLSLLAILMIFMLIHAVYSLYALNNGEQYHLKGLFVFDAVKIVLTAVFQIAFWSIFILMGYSAAFPEKVFPEGTNVEIGSFASGMGIAFMVIAAGIIIFRIIKTVKAIKDLKLYYSAENYANLPEVEDVSLIGTISEAYDALKNGEIRSDDE